MIRWTGVRSPAHCEWRYSIAGFRAEQNEEREANKVFITLYFLTAEASGSATMTFLSRRTGALNWELKQPLLPYFPPDILHRIRQTIRFLSIKLWEFSWPWADILKSCPCICTGWSERNGIKATICWAWWYLPVISALKKWLQENYYQSKVWLVYIGGFRSARGKEWDPASKQASGDNSSQSKSKEKNK